MHSDDRRAMNQLSGRYALKRNAAIIVGSVLGLNCFAQSPLTTIPTATQSLPVCQSERPRSEWTACIGTGKYPFDWVYVGEYRGGKRNGFGRWTSPRGTQHVGNWINDQANGLGVTYDPEGQILESGLFSEGKLIESLTLNQPDFSFERKSTSIDDHKFCLSSATREDSADQKHCMQLISDTKRILEMAEREYQLQLEVYRSQKAEYDVLQEERERQQRQRTAAALATLGAAIGSATNRGDIAKGLAAATRAAQTGNVELPVEPRRSNFPQERTVILPNGRLVNCSIIETVVTCR